MRDLLSHFTQVRKSGSGWSCRCPGHHDQQASLSISRGDRQPWVMRCHAGCSTEQILAAAGLTMQDLLEPRERRANVSTRRTTRYETRDANGHLVAIHERTDTPSGKRFIWRQPDGTLGLGGRRVADLPLYGVETLREVAAGSTVVLCEGERARDAVARAGLVAVATVTGASVTPSDDVLRVLVPYRVVLWADADTPGREHMARIAGRLKALACEDVRRVDWPDAPEGGDAADYRGDLRALVEAAPTHGGVTMPPCETVSPPATLVDVERAFARWIRDEDHVPTRAILAAYVANRKLDGDPVWLMLVGGSGVGKTERLIPLAVMPDVVLESSITGPAALLSGTGKKERAKDASGGVLRKLPEGGGMLLLKDFTSIIDMHRESRAEVLAALREVYDGRWDRSVGAEGGRTLTWTGHVGLVAGCTTAIDSAHSVMSVMGARFMLIRLQGDPDIAASAFDHVGQERPMRDELRAIVRGLLTNLPGTPYDKAEIRTPMLALAKYVALARSPVDRDSQGEIRLVLDAEAPTRIVKMLTQLWRASGLLGLAKPDAWAMVRRVGMDSIPKLRRSILDYLATRPTPTTTTAVAEYVEHPSRTTRRGLEDLAAHRVVQRVAGGEGKADLWLLTTEARAWLDAMTLPDLSGGGECEPPKTVGNVEIPTALIETKITNDDITGKVTFPTTDQGGEAFQGGTRERL